MSRYILACGALAGLLTMPDPAAAQKSTRHHRLASKAAPQPSRSALAQRSWEPAARAWGSFVVAIATPQKDDPAALPNHRCTGVLISKQHVLASGYCVAEGNDEHAVLSPDSLEIYLGARIDAGSKPLAVSEIRRHPDYDPMTFRGDLVVLRLAEPVTAPVEPVKLATAPEPPNRPATNVGWMAEGSGDRQIIMRMSVPQVSSDRCETVLRDQRIEAAQDSYVGIVSNLQVPPDVAISAWKSMTKAMPSLLSKEMMCAGPADGMPCDVDSGSVLLTSPASGAPQLVAVFSSLPVCEVPGIPAVYTRVSAYADWIREMMK